MTFSLTAGNVGRAFEIRTTNNTYGEVLVARPLDRELLDRYTLRVSRAPTTFPLPCLGFTMAKNDTCTPPDHRSKPRTAACPRGGRSTPCG